MCATSVMICAQIMHLIHDDVFALVQQDDRLVRLANPFCKVTFKNCDNRHLSMNWDASNRPLSSPITRYSIRIYHLNYHDGRPLGMAMNPCLSACTSWPGSTLWPNTSTGSPHLDKSNFDNSFGIAVGLLLLVSCLWLNISTWLARSGRVQRKADVQLLWNPHQSSHPRLCWSNVRGWTKSKTFME